MRKASSPRLLLSDLRSRRSSIGLLAAIGGMALLGVIPSTAHAGTMRMSHAAMVKTAMSVSQATPAPQVSMSPLPTAKNVEASPELREVLENILCQCGCGLNVYACEGTMLCSVSSAMRKDASGMLKDGMSSDQVMTAFAADYGEGILAAPPKSGFNLTAWVLPFLVLAAGGLLVGLSIRAWRPKAIAAGAGEFETQTDPTYLERIEKELEQED